MNRYKSTFAILLLILSHGFLKAQGSRQLDSLALVALYNSTNGVNWTINTNWKVQGRAINTWYGVRLDGSGRVSGLDLDGVPNFEEDSETTSGVGLTGNLTDSLRFLTQLSHFDLSFNSGLANTSIPEVFSDMTHLRWLEMYSCGLVGTIPNSLMGLKELFTIGLGHNKLSGTIPSAISSCTNLNYLALCCNGFNESLPALNLPNLQGIYLQNNKFKGSPPPINAPLLNDIRLNNNQLSGCFPASYKQFCSIPNPLQRDFSNNAGLPNNGDFSAFCTSNLNETSVNKSICQGQSYKLPSGRTAQTAGTYRDTLKTVLGCDSVILITNLSVNSIIQIPLSKTICSGQTYTLPKGRVVSTAGTYRDTLKTSGGCDSVIVTTLSVDSKVTNSVTRTICSGQTYTLANRRIISKAGLYVDSLKTTGGCDSIIFLTLNVAPPVSTVVNKSICSRETYALPKGRIVSTAGIYNDTLKTSGGCDSVITTNLSIKSPFIEKSTQRVCSGGTFRLSNSSLATKGGIYRDTLRSAAGCDTVLEITLIIDTIKILKQDTLCEGQTYVLPSGKEVSELGTYKDLLKRQGQCDTLFVITLTEGCTSGLKIYNGVYPEGNENRYFVVEGIENYPQSRLYIYTKTNDMIFKSAMPYDNLWNGTDQNGTPLPADTYYYILDLGVPRLKPEKGYILLVR